MRCAGHQGNGGQDESQPGPADAQQPGRRLRRRHRRKGALRTQSPAPPREAPKAPRPQATPRPHAVPASAESRAHRAARTRRSVAPCAAASATRAARAPWCSSSSSCSRRSSRRRPLRRPTYTCSRCSPRACRCRCRCSRPAAPSRRAPTHLCAPWRRPRSPGSPRSQLLPCRPPQSPPRLPRSPHRPPRSPRRRHRRRAPRRRRSPRSSSPPSPSPRPPRRSVCALRKAFGGGTSCRTRQALLPRVGTASTACSRTRSQRCTV